MPDALQGPDSAGEVEALTPSTVAPPAATRGRGPDPQRLWRVGADLVISLAISAFIIVFLYQPVKVEGTSMMPSLEDQERIFVNKFVYRLEPIERGDIVVFRYPRDPSKSYIKRVIGVAGDRVRIDAGQVYVNEQPIEEDYVPPAMPMCAHSQKSLFPHDSYFVLGDHRSHVERQPRFRSGEARLHLRQSSFRLLADG